MDLFNKKGDDKPNAKQAQDANAAAMQFTSKHSPLFKQVDRALQKAPEGFDISHTVLAGYLSTGTEMFTLASGEVVELHRVVIPHSDILDKTIVNEEINGRDQNHLNEESLKDITSTINLQQYYPAIGFVREDGLIEVLDGSRRRMSAYYVGSDYVMLVAKSVISSSDAKQLAKDLQTAKEHTIRERGTRWSSMKESGLEQKEIANIENVSEAMITRGIKAANISSELLKHFTNLANLTTGDWNYLHGLEFKTLADKKMPVSEFMARSQPSFDEVENNPEHTPQSRDAAIIAIIKGAEKIKQAKKSSKEVIHSYSKNVVMTRQKSTSSYALNFGRVSEEVQKEIEAQAAAILEKHYGQKPVKLTEAQQIAIDNLKALGKPSTSQQIGTQVKTMQALEKLGLVTLVNGDEPLTGRECESLLWSI